MMCKKLRYLSVFIVLVLGCTTSKSISETENTSVARLVEARQYQITNSWLMPMRGRQINLIGNPNYIQIKNDSVEVFLPYFGVRQMGGAYSGDSGIKFSGLMEAYKISENSKKKSYEIEFETHGAETFTFFITIYQSGQTYTNVQSAERDNVSYRGVIAPLPDSL